MKKANAINTIYNFCAVVLKLVTHKQINVKYN